MTSDNQDGLANRVDLAACDERCKRELWHPCILVCRTAEANLEISCIMLGFGLRQANLNLKVGLGHKLSAFTEPSDSKWNHTTPPSLSY
jgi:hypothetical protein